jgi:hypothetical protein
VPGALEEADHARPDGAEEPDAAAPQPPADEADDGTAGTVQPVQVVDDDEQRAARCRLTEQRERRAQHRQAVGRGTRAEAERDLDRRPTGRREAA